MKGMLIIRNLLRKINKKAEWFSDMVSDLFGKPVFLIVHTLWWVIWIVGGIENYPFGLLTLIVSLEAILLSGLILNSSNRAAREDKRLMNKDYDLSQDTNEIVDRMWEEIQDLKALIRAEQIEHHTDLIKSENIHLYQHGEDS